MWLISRLFIRACNIFRAIDVWQLIGNVGGYVGLCLGYCLLQVPEFLYQLLKKMMDYYNKRKGTVAESALQPTVKLSTNKGDFIDLELDTRTKRLEKSVSDIEGSLVKIHESMNDIKIALHKLSPSFQKN